MASFVFRSETGFRHLCSTIYPHRLCFKKPFHFLDVFPLLSPSGNGCLPLHTYCRVAFRLRKPFLEDTASLSQQSFCCFFFLSVLIAGIVRQRGNQILSRVPALGELTVLCGSMETRERGPDQGNKTCRALGWAAPWKRSDQDWGGDSR